VFRLQGLNYSVEWNGKRVKNGRQDFGKKLSFISSPHPDNLLEKLRKTTVNHYDGKSTVESLTWRITGKQFSLRIAVV